MNAAASPNERPHEWMWSILDTSLIASREWLIAYQVIGCGLDCKGSRLQADIRRRFTKASVMRPQRAPSKGKTSLKSGPM